MNKISRKGFLKIAAAAAMSGVTAGALAACNAASGSTSTAASGSAAASGATGTYIPGTYEGTAEGISSTVKVTMTFSDSAVTDVVVDTSGETASSVLLLPTSCAISGWLPVLPRSTACPAPPSPPRPSSEGCQELLCTGWRARLLCPSGFSPTGDDRPAGRTEPDIDEAAITETVDTDISSWAPATAARLLLLAQPLTVSNFRIIERTATQGYRHWYGATTRRSQRCRCEEPFDRAKLLSEIPLRFPGK